MSRPEANTWFESQLLRRLCQVILVGFSSGAFGSSGSKLMLAGTLELADWNPGKWVKVQEWGDAAEARDLFMKAIERLQMLTARGTRA